MCKFPLGLNTTSESILIERRSVLLGDAARGVLACELVKSPVLRVLSHVK